MRVMIILGALLFILLPLDAQLWLVGLVRPLWMTPDGQAFLAGLLGATTGVLIWYAAGWNALARTLRRDDYHRADEAYQRRVRR